jgi:hypothetical protein
LVYCAVAGLGNQAGFPIPDSEEFTDVLWELITEDGEEVNQRSFRPFGEEEPGTWRTAVGAVKCTGCDVSSDRATYANVFRQARDN